MRKQFRLRDLFWLVLVCGLAVAWTLDRQRFQRSEAEAQASMQEAKRNLARSESDNAKRLAMYRAAVKSNAERYKELEADMYGVFTDLKKREGHYQGTLIMEE